MYLLQRLIVIPSCYPLRLVSRLPAPMDFFALLRFILVMSRRVKLRVFFICSLLISRDEPVDMNNHGCRRRTENCPLTRKGVHPQWRPNSRSPGWQQQAYWRCPIWETRGCRLRLKYLLALVRAGCRRWMCWATGLSLQGSDLWRSYRYISKELMHSMSYCRVNVSDPWDISSGVFLGKYNLVYMLHVAVRGTWPSTCLKPRNPRHDESILKRFQSRE